MKRIFLISLLLISLNCLSQVDSALLDTWHPPNLGIGTVYNKDSSISVYVYSDSVNFSIRDTRTGFKFVTDYRCLFERIIQHFDENIKSYYVQYKKDESGKFKHYTIYLTADIKRKVLDYLSESQ